MTIATQTATDLNDLKSAMTSNVSLVYDRSLWNWTFADYTGQADDINIVKANNTALSVGAWLRQRASNVVYQDNTVDAALTAQQSKLKHVVYVTDPPYNANATMSSVKQSAAIVAAINANKGGTIIIPADLALTYSGIILSGPSYDNTSIIVQDDSIFEANPNPLNGNFQTTIYCMFAFHDCSGCSLEITGSINGNRSNQPASQQQPIIVIAGATNFKLKDGWTVKEIRGDGVTIIKKTLSDPNSKNSDTIYIGSGSGINSADDGRNLVSLISGSNVMIGSCISINIGGTINGERMPGGWDCEPNHNAGDYVSNVTKALWLIKTAGTSGSAWIGASRSGNDGARDWNIVDIHDIGSIVIHTATDGRIGGPIIRRVARGRIVADLRRASRNAGISIDYVDFCDINVTASGCSTAITLGYSDKIVDSKIEAIVTDYSVSAILATGLEHTTVTARVRNPRSVGCYGLNIAKAMRTSVTQIGVRYTLDCPDDPNLALAIRNAGVVFGSGTVVVGGSLLGYASNAKQIGSTDGNVIPTEHVRGRNYASAAPVSGTWAADDFVKRIGISGGASPGWYNVAAGAPNFKAAAAIAV